MNAVHSNDLISPRGHSISRFLLIFIMVFAFLMFTLVIILESLEFPGYLLGYDVVVSTLGGLIILELTLSGYHGIKVLLLVKTGLTNSATKTELLQKNTVVMFLQILSFLFLLIVLVIYVVLSERPSFTQLDSLQVYLSVNVTMILGLISSYYFFYVPKLAEPTSEGEHGVKANKKKQKMEAMPMLTESLGTTFEVV